MRREMVKKMRRIFEEDLGERDNPGARLKTTIVP